MIEINMYLVKEAIVNRSQIIFIHRNPKLNPPY